MQWSCVCPLLGLDLPRRGWSSPSYRDHLDSLQYQHILQNATVPSVRILYPNGIIIYSKTTPFMILVWFKNGYCGRPTSNSLTGHRECLIWTPSRICGVHEIWPVLPPRNSDDLWALVSDAWDEVASSMRCTRSLSPWHNEWNHGLIEEVSFWKQPF